MRAVASEIHHLAEGRKDALSGCLKHAEEERKRRAEETRLYQDVSRYYPLPGNKKTWRRPLSHSSQY